METATYWEDSSSMQNHLKFEGSNDCSSRPCKEEQGIFRYCDGNLNFATAVTSEEDDYGFHKKKISRDPMSHRIIEKRRRDRMNNCLADLSRLIPADYLKKGRGRIEKTEIIEMAIKHMKHLQAHACRQLDTCELAHQQQNQEERNEQHSKRGPIVLEHYRLGYQECLSETMLFLVEVEGFFAGDPLCVQLINHLQKHCDKILKGDRLNFPHVNNGETTSTSSGSSASGGSIPLGASGMSSGSPGSGSSSDSSGRTENRDSGIGSGLPPTSHGGAEDSSYEDGIMNLSSTSQLREMLTSPKLSSISIPPGEKNHSGSLILHHRLQHLDHSPASPAGVCASASAADQSGGASGASVASLYKFKNNIKQRFSAEHHVESNESNNDTMSGHVSRSYEMVLSRKRHNLDVNHDHEDSKSTLTLNMLRRRDSDTCSVSSMPHSPPLPSVNKFPRVHSPLTEAPQSPPPPHRSLSAPSYGVPIFALDFRGSYYVPLTLDMEILAPYFAQLGFGQEVSNSSSSLNVVLHPVTISVNFQHTNQHRMLQNPPQRQRHFNSGCVPVSSWKTESQEFIPKWPMCSADRG